MMQSGRALELGQQLAEAAMRDDRLAVEDMIASRFPLNAKLNGRTALMHAADRGHDILAAILDKAGARTVSGESLVDYQRACQRERNSASFLSRLFDCCGARSAEVSLEVRAGWRMTPDTPSVLKGDGPSTATTHSQANSVKV